MRMADGLPPLAPRKLYDGSKVGPAHMPRTSSTPTPTYYGIVVYDSNGISGTRLGYIANTLNSHQYYQFTTDCSVAPMSLQLSSGVLTKAANPTNRPNVGMTSLHTALLTTTYNSYTWMSPTVNARSSLPVAYGSGWIEDSIWSLGGDNELIATWTNRVGAPPDMAFFYAPSNQNSILSAANLPATQTAYSETAGAIGIRLFLAVEPFQCVV